MAVSSDPYAVMMRNGTCGFRWWTRSSSSMPRISGISRSEMTMSNASCENRSSASFPLAASVTVYPSFLRINESDSRMICSSSTTRMRSAMGSGQFRVKRKGDREGDAARDIAVDGDRAAHAAHDPVTDPEAEARPAARLLGREKGLEDL